MKSEIEVLPADTEKKPLGFSIVEYIGGSLSKDAEGFDLVNHPIKPGDKVYAYGLSYTVVETSIGLCLDMGGSFGLLSFDVDDRHCGVCTLVYNKKLINHVRPRF
jgi:hypothetical protein